MKTVVKILTALITLILLVCLTACEFNYSGATATMKNEPTPTERHSIQPTCVLVIQAGDKTLYAGLENNPSAEALKEKLSPAPITVDMDEYSGLEKIGDLPWELPTNDREITTDPGDIVLYQGNKIAIYYGKNTWSFTRLAKISNITREELLEVLTDDEIQVTFSLEWSE